MLGPEGVVELVRGRLVAALNPKLDELRTRYGVDARALPPVDPRNIITHEPDGIGLDRFPLISVMELDTDPLGGPQQMSISGAGNVYRFDYSIAIQAWVWGGNYESTGRARQRLLLAVREVLLQRKGLLPHGGDEACTFDPNQYHEEYSDVGRDGDQRVIAGSTAIAHYLTEEWLAAAQPAVGTVETPPAVGFELLP